MYYVTLEKYYCIFFLLSFYNDLFSSLPQERVILGLLQKDCHKKPRANIQHLAFKMEFCSITKGLKDGFLRDSK